MLRIDRMGNMLKSCDPFWYPSCETSPRFFSWQMKFHHPNMGRLIPSTGDPNPGISAWRVLSVSLSLFDSTVSSFKSYTLHRRIPSSRMGMFWTFRSNSYKMISAHMTFWPWHILLMVQKSWRNQLVWTKHLKQQDIYHLDWPQHFIHQEYEYRLCDKRVMSISSVNLLNES